MYGQMGGIRSGAFALASWNLINPVYAQELQYDSYYTAHEGVER